MPKVIGIVGSRRRNTHNDYMTLKSKFDEIYEDGDTIVSGGCQTGGDMSAEQIARSMGLSIMIHHAAWKEIRTAGFVRNTKIAAECDVLIALVATDRCGGVEDTIHKAKAMNKQIIIV